jgi:PKD repeat protein
MIAIKENEIHRGSAASIPVSRPRFSRSAVMVILITAITLAGAVAALAARPKPGGRFTGNTSQAKFNGFHGTVSFTVARGGAKLLRFKFSSSGCGGSAGLQPGVNYLLQPQNVYPFGTIKVSSNGKFSIRNAKYLYKQKGFTTLTTTVTISGTFSTATKANGTISYKQTGVGTCAPPRFSFSATAK